MSLLYKGRLSDSPYVESIWRGRAARNCSSICPADSHWIMMIIRQMGRLRVSVDGLMTKASIEYQPHGTERLIITLKLGTFMPELPAKDLVGGKAILSDAAGKSFWLNGLASPIPDYDNVETFVSRLTRGNLLMQDSIAADVLSNKINLIEESY